MFEKWMGTSTESNEVKLKTEWNSENCWHFCQKGWQPFRCCILVCKQVNEVGTWLFLLHCQHPKALTTFRCLQQTKTATRIMNQATLSEICTHSYVSLRDCQTWIICVLIWYEQICTLNNLTLKYYRLKRIVIVE